MSGHMIYWISCMTSNGSEDIITTSRDTLWRLVFSGSGTYGAATIDTNDLAGDIGSRRHTEE